MRWVIKGSDGWSSMPYRDRRHLREALRVVRDSFTTMSDNHTVTYKVTRLVTKREKLKRDLLVKSSSFEKDARMHAPADRHWYEGYARALRDVAGLL
jgi:hypothetical protein